MTPYYASGERRLISRNDLAVLQDAYGYTVEPADYFGTEYDALDSNGTLRISFPAGTAANSLVLSTSGSQVTVYMTLGTPVAGSDASIVSTTFAASSVTSVQIVGGAGNDSFDVTALGSGVPVYVTGNGGADTLDPARGRPDGHRRLQRRLRRQRRRRLRRPDPRLRETGPTRCRSRSPSPACPSPPVARWTSSAGSATTRSPTAAATSGRRRRSPTTWAAGPTPWSSTTANAAQPWSYTITDTVVTSTDEATNVVRTDGYNDQAESLTLLSGSGNDTFYPRQTSTAAVASLVGGDGNDDFNFYLPSGTVSVDGGAGTDTAEFYDDNATAAQTYTVSTAGVSRPGAAVNVANVEGLTLDVGKAAETVDVTGVPAATAVTVNAGLGADAIDVSTESEAIPSFDAGLTINGALDGETSLTLDDSGAGSGVTREAIPQYGCVPRRVRDADLREPGRAHL